MSSIVKSLENYIFSSKNIIDYTKNIYNEDNNFIEKKEKIHMNKGLFTPHQVDSLFWCYYVIINGLDEYKMVGCHQFEKEKKLKFELIEKVRLKKNELKANNFKLINSFEDDLANSEKINLNTFMALLCLEDKNIIYIEGKKIYKSIRNESDAIYILYQKEKNVSYFELELHVSQSQIDKLSSKYFEVPSFNYKLKALSSYSMNDLKDMCEKYEIKLNENEKYLKKDLYDKIKVFF